MHIRILRVEIALKQQAGFSFRPAEFQAVKIIKAADHVALYGGGINPSASSNKSRVE
jgi:hypothetical protein